MKQQWVLQGRSIGLRDEFPEWCDLLFERRIKDLPRVNVRIAEMIGAEYRIVLKEQS